ncbi:MAG: response regulator [Bryobacteraceae bacterium]|nr:response regulator [Bryobacteraceae bacterium]
MLAVVCDDFKPSACLLAQIIEEEGFETLCVSDGWHVIQILQNWIVDLLVIDILMPDLDGLETIRRIREMRLKTKVVAVSGGSAEYLAAARMMGASMTFSKPVSTRALREFATKLNTAAGGDPGGRVSEVPR